MDNKVKRFTKNIDEALDEVAPYKSFTIKSQYKFGLSLETKDLMYKRDQTRKKIKIRECNSIYSIFVMMLQGLMMV